MLDCDRTLISCYERGKTVPQTAKAIELAKIYNASLDYIFGLSDIREISKGDTKMANDILETETIEQTSQLTSDKDIDADGIPDRIDSQYNTPDELYCDENGCRYAVVTDEQKCAVKESVKEAVFIKTDDDKIIARYPSAEQKKVSEIINMKSQAMNLKR